MPLTNGHIVQEMDLGKDAEPSYNTRKRYPRRAGQKEIHDILCVGFGPASLAIAVALHDAVEEEEKQSNLTPLASVRGKKYSNLKVAFIEKQSHFAWHAGMLLPGTKMQISFIKDLATLRNPRSEFTFLNYLHENDRLVQFTNLSTFLPQRLEYEDYMRWCAQRFGHLVTYGEEVVNIFPNTTKLDSSNGKKTSHFAVISRETNSNDTRIHHAKHVIVAIGGKPNIPKSLPQNHPRVVHSSHFATAVPKLLPEREKAYSVAVIGGGQSAAEIFDYLMSEYPKASSKLIIRDSALRPSDDSPL